MITWHEFSCLCAAAAWIVGGTLLIFAIGYVSMLWVLP